MTTLKDFMNIYQFDTTLPGSNEKINYKGLTTNSLKKLLMWETEKDSLRVEDLIDHIIKISVEGEIDTDNMYITDRYYMFIKIKEATNGSEFQVQQKCSNCKNDMIVNIDLSKLKIELPNDIDPKIQILNDKMTLYLSHPKRSTQKKLFSFINKKLPDNEKQIEMGVANLASYVEKIETHDGEIEIDYKDLTEFIGDLNKKEIDKFRNWEEKYSFGISLKQHITCHACKHEEDIILPIDVFFS